MGTPARIFVSHITDEAEVAALLKESIEEDFAGAVELFASSDVGAINTSDDWLDAVQRAMAEAVAVVVLCSKSSVHRPWVQFEVGAAWMKEIPIIPVCHSGLRLIDLDEPLSRLQGLELGTEAGIKRLYLAVSSLLGLTKPRGPKDAAGLLERIHALEEQLGSIRTEQYERYLDITVPAEALGRPAIPDDATVESDDLTLRLFGLTAAVPRCWRDVVDAAQQQPDTRWVRQLERCIQEAGMNRVFRPVQAVFHGDHGSFQPQLARKDVLRGGTTRFHVHLIETVVAPTAGVPSEIVSLVTLLRLGLRFRYEVIERFRALGQRAPAGTPARDVPQETLAALREAIEVIETDARSRGAEHVEADAASLVFEGAAEQAEMARLAEAWADAREQLFRDEPPPTAEDLVRVLGGMRRINARFMRAASARFEEVVQLRWPDALDTPPRLAAAA